MRALSILSFLVGTAALYMCCGFGLFFGRWSLAVALMLAAFGLFGTAGWMWHRAKLADAVLSATTDAPEFTGGLWRERMRLMLIFLVSGAFIVGVIFTIALNR